MSKYVIINNGLVAGVRYTPAKNTVTVEDDFELPETGSEFLSAYKEYKLKQVRNKYNDSFNAIRNKYNGYEVESFVDQKAEWKLYIADNTVDTPIVNALAQARGIDREVLLDKIGKNITTIAGIQGQQNALEDLIKACTTIEELDAIVM